MKFVAAQRATCLEQVQRFAAMAFAPGADCPAWAAQAIAPQWNVLELNTGVCSLAQLYQALGDRAIRSKDGEILRQLHRFLHREERQCLVSADQWEATLYLTIATDALDDVLARIQEEWNFRCRLQQARAALPSSIKAFPALLAECREAVGVKARQEVARLKGVPGRFDLEDDSERGEAMRALMMELTGGYNKVFAQARRCASLELRKDMAVAQALRVCLDGEIREVERSTGPLMPLRSTLVVALKCLRDGIKQSSGASGDAGSGVGRGVGAGPGGGGGHPAGEAVGRDAQVPGASASTSASASASASSSQALPDDSGKPAS